MVRPEIDPSGTWSQSMADGGDESRTDRHIKVGWRLAGVGGETASMVLGGLVIGWGVSEFMGSRTWIVVGGVAGVLTGVMTLIRGSLKLNAEMDKESGVRRGGGGTGSGPASGIGDSGAPDGREEE